MAVRKRTKKPVQTNIASNKQAMLWYVVLIIGAVVFALAYLWRHLPTRPTYQAPQTPIAQEPNQKQRLSCERAGGKWTDCGNPCHGQDVESCVAMCEPQCLCGGGPNYSCPVNTVCTNKVSAKPGEVAIGVCRDKALAQTPTTTTDASVKIIASLDASTYPFILKGSVAGTSTAIWWTATDADATVVGRGTIQWPATSTAAFEQRVFLSGMPTSTALRFIVVAGSEKLELNATSTKLVPMARTVYIDDPDSQSDACDGLRPKSTVLPKTSYPFEAVMRATIQQYLIGYEVNNGIATITIPDQSSFGYDQCTPEFIKGAASEIKKDFPAIKDLVIQEQNAQTQP